MSYSEYIGRQATHREVLEGITVERLAATLGVTYTPGTALPPTWHWLMFQEWPPAKELGTDGHPQPGSFLPSVPELPRRMRAGGRLEFRGDLPCNETVTRTRTIVAVREKRGASGPLVFVTLRDEFAIASGIVLLEEQDIVYLGSGALAPPPVNEPALSEQHPVAVDSVTLFRYSALTGNNHRIHYDADYARDVEHHRGVVVHGPLQATWLAGLATRTGAALAAFVFRARRPAYLVNAPFSAEAAHEGAALRLQTRDRHGTICMEATAIFAL
jgi:3-methylfumaryl-CoA hydratase